MMTSRTLVQTSQHYFFKIYFPPSCTEHVVCVWLNGSNLINIPWLYIIYVLSAVVCESGVCSHRNILNEDRRLPLIFLHAHDLLLSWPSPPIWSSKLIWTHESGSTFRPNVKQLTATETSSPSPAQGSPADAFLQIHRGDRHRDASAVSV